MKTTTAVALGLLLAATAAAQADAQARPNRAARAEDRDGPGRPAARMVRPPQAERAPAVAPTPPPAPRAPEAPRAGDRGGREWPARGHAVDEGGAIGVRPGADGQDDEDWDELRQARRWGGDHGAGWTDHGDGRRDDHRDGRGRGRDDHWDDDHHRDDDHRGDGRGRDHDGRGGGWDRGRDDDHGQPHWGRGRYPPAYFSPRRFHYRPYLPPTGFYARVWSFGEILPRGWYAPDYRLVDWWAWGLPAPPPGYDWIRVGDDALLVDRYTGRIVQVVRYLFW